MHAPLLAECAYPKCPYVGTDCIIQGYKVRGGHTLEDNTMADLTEKDMEKAPLNESASNEPYEDEMNDSKAKFLNGGKTLDEPQVAIEVGSNDDTVSFTGLGKEELMKYADDPFWKKVRIILLVLFWVGWVAMLVAAIVIIVLAPRCPYRPDQKWYDKESVYQVYPRSFKDSTEKPKTGQTPEGAGLGDLTGK